MKRFDATGIWRSMLPFLLICAFQKGYSQSDRWYFNLEDILVNPLAVTKVDLLLPNPLNGMPPSMQRCQNLIYLKAEAFSFENDSFDYRLLKSLEELRLTADGLNKIPRGLFGLSRLFVLDLSYNNIKVLDFDQLPKGLEKLLFRGQGVNRLLIKGSVENGLLAYIDIGKNQIGQLPWEVLLPLKHLQVLKVDEASLSIIDDAAELSKSLKELDLSDNPIESIPDRLIDHSPLLESIDISHTSVNQLPLAFFKLSHLKWLGLEGTPLAARLSLEERISFSRALSLRNPQLTIIW